MLTITESKWMVHGCSPNHFYFCVCLKTFIIKSWALVWYTPQGNIHSGCYMVIKKNKTAILINMGNLTNNVEKKEQATENFDNIFIKFKSKHN